jgi:hypothetical protein
MFAINNGMKSRECAAVIQDFISEIKPAMRECGLNFRTLEDLDTPLPADLDLTV